MDNYIIPGALFLVMILLLLVVYDSNTTMQKTVGKIRRQRPEEMTASRQEVVTMEAQQITATGEYLASSAQAQPQSAIAVHQVQILENMPAVAMENSEQLIMPSDNIIQTQEKPGNIMEWYVGYFRRLLRKGNQEKPAMQAVHIQQQDTMTSTISELQSALADEFGIIKGDH
jgi:hypothetical protein